MLDIEVASAPRRSVLDAVVAAFFEEKTPEEINDMFETLSITKIIGLISAEGYAIKATRDLRAPVEEYKRKFAAPSWTVYEDDIPIECFLTERSARLYIKIMFGKNENVRLEGRQRGVIIS